MGIDSLETSWNEKLKALLKERGYGFCTVCKRELDQGDLAWNNGNTESGTPYSIVVCNCQACDTEIFLCRSWYPEIDDLKDVCYVLENDLKRKNAG